MRILLVNKFLYQKGGAETYVFKLGEMLTKHGHQVEYFGLENEKNIVGNNAGSYVSDIDFSTGVGKNLKAPFRIIYSGEARKKLKKVLYDFKPDIIHLNNIQFHLTPSIILEANKFRKKTKSDLKIIYTAHDYQLICPSHGLFDTDIRVCEKCLGGNYTHCLRTKCVKGSLMKSFLGMMDAYTWKISKAYSYIDKIICPSHFLKGKLDTQKRFADKTVALHNFIEDKKIETVVKDDYVLEFGHLSRDKGTNTLLAVAKRIPDVRFLFAGYGVAVDDMKDIDNAQYVGFKTGEELVSLISRAKCSIYPSEWYENCPFSVIESQMFRTPVICSRMGGIPELVKDKQTGLLFEAGNADDLEEKLRYFLYTDGIAEEYTENCKDVSFETPETYYSKLIKIYEE
ncbi:MAG: glycosyltransferase family 4 protein [Ruminococcaceae bacterium]|nr:glycosyltransferase family 4 protein [Oscillospiraceae bacterium]